MEQCKQQVGLRFSAPEACDVVTGIIWMVIGLAWLSLPLPIAAALLVLLTATKIFDVNIDLALIASGIAGLLFLISAQIPDLLMTQLLASIVLAYATKAVLPRRAEMTFANSHRLLLRAAPLMVAIAAWVLGVELSRYSIGILLVAVSVLALFVPIQQSEQ